MARLLLALLFASCHAAASAAPLELFRDRLFLAAEVNGRPVAALLDSGAEMSLLDDDFAAALGLVAAGGAAAHGSGAEAMEARFAQGVDIAAAGLLLAGRTVAILDLGEVSERLIGRPVDMILGRDLFDAGRWTIDIEQGRFAAAPDGEPEGRRYALTSQRGIETFEVTVEGEGPVAAVFDLGNGSELLVGRAFAERAGLLAPGRIVERRAGGGLGGAVERDIVLLRSLELGGRTFEDVPAAIDDSPTAADLNIGTRILRHFLITADFPQRALWLAPRP